MTTHEELKKQIANLQAQAEEMKRVEKAAAIDSIVALMADHGVTVADLGKPVKIRAKSPPKYRNPANPPQTWSGHGRKPAWAKDYSNLDDLLIPA